MHRRQFIAALAASVFAPVRAVAAEPTVIRVNLPGPGALPFMPLELISALGFDKAVGARLDLRYHISGVLAFEDMIAGNADFSSHGFAILPALARKGKRGAAIVSMAGQAAAVAMLVRHDLAKEIRQISDLKGRVVATTSGSGTAKTYMQMTGEVLLARHGVEASQVRWVQAGQTLEGIGSVLQSRAVDAVWCEEPFASQAVKQGIARFLMHEAASMKVVNEIGHMRSVVSMAVEPRDAAYEQRAALMVRMTQNALRWMRRHNAAQIVQALPDAETRDEVLDVLRRYPNLFSPDGRFSNRTVTQAGTLLAQLDKQVTPAELRTYIEPRWAGLDA